MQVEITVGSTGIALGLGVNKLKVGKDLAYYAYTQLYEPGVSSIQNYAKEIWTHIKLQGQ